MGIDAPAVPEGTRHHARGRRSADRGAVVRWVAVVSSLVFIVLIGAEASSGWDILHSTGFFTALAAQHYVWANAGAAVLVAAAAALAPGRWRWWAVLGPAAFLLAVLVATAIPGGQLLGMVAALLTMTALWDTGERLLRRLGAESLARIALVAWLAGIAPWSLLLVILGRLSLVKWWTVGILFIAVGAGGLVRLTGRVLTHRRAVVGAVAASSLSFASAGLILLTCGWIAIYTAAPEIQYDPLYGKAFLPELWGRTGHIGAIVQHVQDAIVGWFQILAVNGELIGATSVGRYLQLIALISAAVAVWWWGHRHGSLGPLAAVAVVVTPQLLWQASTAYDDLLLALAALAFCVAIVESLRSQPTRHVRGVAFALGLMAGTGPSLKLHLTPLFACLLLGWIATGRSSRTIRRRFAYAALGAAVTALPPLVLRWVETGNPLLPAYNNIFRSPYWLPINETLNFPFWKNPGAFGPFTGIWKAVVEPSLMAEAAPPGAYGLLIGATLIAVLLGWRARDSARAGRIVWIALLPALLFWWVSFRYLRYLLPIDFVSIALVLMLVARVKPGRVTRLLALFAATIAVIASFPVTLGQFWNVPLHKPPVYAAIGRWSASSYLNDGFTERPAILAFNRLSPRDARMASDAFQRSWLAPERDLYNLHYEVIPLMELHGPTPQPTTGDQALADLRRLGIEWVMVTEGDRYLNAPNYLSQVITTHGAISFAARGWDLYHLVDRPPAPTPLSSCDAVRKGVSACWGVAPTTSLTASVTRSMPACPGETLAVNVAQAAGGGVSPVTVQFTGGSASAGFQLGIAIAGTEQSIYATAPPGTTGVSVQIIPGVGARILTARLGRLGPPCK